ncbi:glutamate-5-semialdehyde dehydrogenase [Pseudanabaena sp. FACHB-2040]|uniref:glutamate-5-semialdehyde dehydrogenase n=1 Tax=Pseudanabaena sp. FACHB-2040 TaxID=2692859 RepID=UPI001685D966|nr:glutamate-5-semialdehyde dehydrogenase [Pseudanabaena sp. FACHB-2040]MBD2257342.1 glutamate-5-semialdehyde dehydrogenase [Pseudanabaena sp. FACHB-2040]
MTLTGSSSDLTYAIYQVRQASRKLFESGAVSQSHLLEVMASELEKNQDEVLEANTLDLEASLEMAVPERVLDWLKLTPERIQTTAKILRRLSSLGDPRVLAQQPLRRMNQSATGYGQVVPLGVIGLVYEAFPELTAIAAGLCVRTGNGLILKGGNEASQSNQAITQILHRALDRVNLPEDCILSLSSDQGDAARTQLVQSEGVDLIIPYGRPSLIQQVLRQATISVLPTAMGNCYLYWAASGELETVFKLILDSHRGEPDAVNAIEKVLIHESHSPASVAQLCRQLWEQGFELRGDNALLDTLPDLLPLDSAEWDQSYLEKMVALRRVDSLETAAALINRHSSGHADCLATESYREAYRFTQAVQSAAVYINASPRFSRNPTQASAISLGMTSQRWRGSGFIGLEALMTVKHVIQGI